MSTFRTIYEIKNNALTSVVSEKFLGSPYFMFLKDDNLIVNRSIGKDLTKKSILFDIECLNKYKESGKFKDVKGLSKSFIDKLNKDFEITEEEVKEAINLGKSYNRRGINIRSVTAGANSRLTGFTVDRERGLH